MEFPVRENIAIRLYIFRYSSNSFLQWGKFHFGGAFLFFCLCVLTSHLFFFRIYLAWMFHHNSVQIRCIIINHQKNFQPTDNSIDDSLTCLLAWIQVLTCDASDWHNGFKFFWKEHFITLVFSFQGFIHLLHELGCHSIKIGWNLVHMVVDFFMYNWAGPYRS